VSSSHDICWLNVAVFFFSSRRRHTRWPRDWSSDVCSSDLRDSKKNTCPGDGLPQARGEFHRFPHGARGKGRAGMPVLQSSAWLRSEERRVGKECRCRWSAGWYNRKAWEGNVLH